MKQQLEATLWNVLENFYTSYRLFSSTYEHFEEKLQEFCSNKQMPQEDLVKILKPEEWVSLLENARLESILEYLYTIRKLLRELQDNGYYNPEFGCENFEDQIVTLYHIIGNVCNESERLSQHAMRRLELESNITNMHTNGANNNFGEKEVFLLYTIRSLKQSFQEAMRELENIIANHKESSIILRSLFLFGDEIFQGYDFISQVYTHGLFEMYVRSAYSFFSSGFYSLAQKAVALAQNISVERQDAEIKEKLDIFVGSNQYFLANYVDV